MKCPVCGKRFDVLWPNQWAYKRGNNFICSWGCIRKYDRKEADGMQGKAILTDKQKRKAIEMALNGESPLPYLKECGAANPTTTWQSVLNWAKKNCDRDVYEELPKSFGQPKKANGVDVPPQKPGEPKPPAEPKVELVYDESIAEEYRREHPELYPQPEEKVKAVEPLPIASVWSRVIDTGTYRKVNGVGMMLELGPLRDGPLMLNAEDWRKFAEEIGIALEMLKADETVEV